MSENVAARGTCRAPRPGQSPDYYDPCRWKAQNVKVPGNTFNMNDANVPGCRGAQNSCGENALFSQFGTDPGWSPYQGEVIEQAITAGRGNLFSDNTYNGTWEFMYHDQSGILSLARWNKDGQD